MFREYAFRIKTGEGPLMRFTRDHPDHKVLIQLLRPSAEQLEERAVLVFLGPEDPTMGFLRGEFTKRYGTYVPLREEAGQVSVEVSTHLLPTIHDKTPLELTYEILGPDAVFLPLLVKNGWLHIRVISADTTAGKNFHNALNIMRNQLRPEDFHVYPVRPYRPERRLQDPAEDITDRQLEVVKTAFEMGYWADPRECNLEDIAQRFGVSKAAVHKSLSAAQRKIMRSFFEEHLDARLLLPGERNGSRDRRHHDRGSA